jgi:hypothetical protein
MGAHRQRVKWSKRERALLYCFDGDKPTSMLIAYAFEHVKVHDGGDGVERSLAAELERRGYDLTTLKFDIKPIARQIATHDQEQEAP